MKKLLLSSVAFGALALAPAVANAQVSLELGGFFKGYGAFVDQDEDGTAKVNDFDLLRYTEVHFSGETTLDNGLTVGAHIEAGTDGADGFAVDESYVYFSGSWGRVNLGEEDGAAYLLQVSAPSADSNVDGIRQYIQPVNYDVLLGSTSTTDIAGEIAGGLDYDNDLARSADKITYLSPIMNGFQAGLSYSPDSDNADDLDGVGQDDEVGILGATYEVALRYEGEFNGVGLALGAGYAQSDLDAPFTGAGLVEETDDVTEWNVGLDLDFGPFGLGVVYTETDNGEIDADGNTGGAVVDDEETFVVGVDYTTGAFKFGASYLDSDNTFGIQDLESQRYTGGVVYSYAPGVSFRGSVSFVDHDGVNLVVGSGDSADATSVLFGTQVSF